MCGSYRPLPSLIISGGKGPEDGGAAVSEFSPHQRRLLQLRRCKLRLELRDGVHAEHFQESLQVCALGERPAGGAKRDAARLRSSQSAAGAKLDTATHQIILASRAAGRRDALARICSLLFEAAVNAELLDCSKADLCERLAPLPRVLERKRGRRHDDRAVSS